MHRNLHQNMDRTLKKKITGKTYNVTISPKIQRKNFLFEASMKSKLFQRKLIT